MMTDGESRGQDAMRWTTPFLTTERLRFDWWHTGDGDLLHALHRDPRVQRGYPFGAEAWTRPAIDNKLAGYVRDQHSLGFTKWKLSLHDGTFVGRCGWSLWEGSGLELGYALMPAFHQRGLAREAAQAAVEWALASSREALVGFALPENAPSRSILQGVGMAFTGERAIGGILHAFYEMDRAVPAT